MTQRASELTLTGVRAREMWNRIVTRARDLMFPLPLGQQRLSPSQRGRAVLHEAQALVYGRLEDGTPATAETLPEAITEPGHLYELLPSEVMDEVDRVFPPNEVARLARQTGAAFIEGLAQDPERGPAVVRKAVELAVAEARRLMDVELAAQERANAALGSRGPMGVEP